MTNKMVLSNEKDTKRDSENVPCILLSFLQSFPFTTETFRGIIREGIWLHHFAVNLQYILSTAPPSAAAIDGFRNAKFN